MEFIKKLLIAFSLSIVLVGGGRALGQSSDQSLPTPVLTNEVKGNIVPLDLGDSRLTRHFYAFEGTPGDLIITVTSRNLNGDMDVFTAVTFRPLMKINIFANTIAPQVTKSVYLRTRQILILRVEARSPNDDPGNYSIRFSGGFAPFSGGIPVAESSEEKTEVASNKPGTRRVSSVGATIAEPPPETPSATPEPTPSTETATEKPAEEKETKAPPRSGSARPPRSSSTARNPRRRTPPARPKPAPPKTEAPRTETEEPKKETGAGEEKSAVSTPEKPATEDKPAAQETSSPQPGARLIIEEKDGTRIDRPMSTIRRVIVEGSQIVIVLKTGRIERIPMSNVARMAIEP